MTCGECQRARRNKTKNEHRRECVFHSKMVSTADNACREGFKAKEVKVTKGNS